MKGSIDCRDGCIKSSSELEASEGSSNTKSGGLCSTVLHESVDVNETLLSSSSSSSVIVICIGRAALMQTGMAILIPSYISSSAAISLTSMSWSLNETRCDCLGSSDAWQRTGRCY